MDEVVLTAEQYQRLIEKEITLNWLLRAILQDASDSFDKSYLVFDIGSQNTLNLVKLVAPASYNARLEQLKLQRKEEEDDRDR